VPERHDHGEQPSGSSSSTALETVLQNPVKVEENGKKNGET